MNILSKKDINKIIKLLEDEYPDAKTALRFSTPLELLIATILSAQCTDERVNKVTSELFKKYKSCKDYAKANLEELESQIKSINFYKNKAKNIISLAKIIEEKYGERVPHSIKELITLPGVARKTANVVLSSAFKKAEGIAVDTHVKRVTRRLGLTESNDPLKIEKDLMSIIPKTQWLKISYRLIEHGRKICKSKNPLCFECILKKLCPTKKEFYLNE